MAPFFIPTPCIIPLRVPVFGENRNIKTDTKIEMLCETDIPNVEIFYTIDGTKPQPYLGIVQGSKAKKYAEPFCLPSGKITIKAIAIHSQVHTMFSSVITKSFRVDSVEPNVKAIKSMSKLKLKHQKKLKSVVKSNFEDKSYESENKIIESCDDTSTEEKHSNGAVTSPLDVESEDSDIDIRDKDSEDSFATYVIESEDIDICEVESPDCILRELDRVNDEAETIQVKETATTCDILPAQCHTCSQCEMPLQHCFACNKVNAIVSKYCDKCGEKLVQECKYCQEQNPSIAIFCQYCGKKFEPNTNCQEKKRKLPKNSNQSVMAKPQLKSFSAQKSPATDNKCVQTTTVLNKKNNQNIIDVKRLPKHTPGRGYWRQQIDYICNHLKAHANNNLDFRKSIGEPSLHQFMSANIDRNDESIVVKIEFSLANSEQMTLTENLHENKVQ